MSLSGAIEYQAMAPATTQPLLLSPAELSYLHTSLSSHPTIRPDGRTNTQFRPLIAETDILPTTNGSARICFADGTEAIVGIKAEVEKSGVDPFSRAGRERLDDEVGEEDEGDDGIGGKIAKGEGATGRNEWVEISVEIPGCREDDSMVVFVGQLLSEALLSDGEFAGRLWINGGWHWKLYVDVSGIVPRNNGQLLILFTDFATLAAIVISITTTIAHDTSRPLINPLTKTQIRIRRGSTIR